MRGCRSSALILFPEVFPIANIDHQINDEIQDAEVRLIGENGEQLGIMPSAEALKIAEEHGYDLVKIAPNANPPVCRVMDYGKFRFEQVKKEKEAKKNQKTIEIMQEMVVNGEIDGEIVEEVNAVFRFYHISDQPSVTEILRAT